MASLKVFIDHASQPSRAVLVFCKIAKAPFELVQTRIVKMQNRSPEFAKVNPNKKVPAILHGDFNLFESHAIMKYIARQFNAPQQWYPRNDVKKMALIDEYLDWHHTNTRKCAPLFFWTRIGPTSGLETPKSFNFEEAQREVKNCLKFINSYFLGNTPYILSDKPTIADLSAYQQIIQLKMIQYDFSGYPKIQSWFKLVQSIPEVEEQNVIFNKIVSTFAKKFPLSKL